MTPSDLKSKIAVYRECLDIIEASENRQDARERIAIIVGVAGVQLRSLERQASSPKKSTRRNKLLTAHAN